MVPLTVLICDDHPLVRMALVHTVQVAFDSVSVLEAQSFTEAISLADRADLCLCDLSMPGGEPLEGIEALLAKLGTVPLVVVTGSADDKLMLALLDRGVSGFVPKDASTSTLTGALHLVLAGGRYMPERLLELANAARPSASPSGKLTAQQSRVLAFIAEGLTNKEIAREMNVAPSTVKTHLDAILRGLEARNRQDAVTRARAAGLLD